MPDRPLRILGVGDANSRHLIRWARRLADRGHDLHLASNRVSPRGDLDGLTIHRFDEADPLLAIPGLRRFRFGHAVRRIVRTVKPDVVHSHYLLPYGYWTAQARVQPLVVSPWGKDAIVDARGGGRAQERARTAVAPGLLYVVNSSALEQATIELGADPSRFRRVLWHANIDPYTPEHRDPDFRTQRGWPDDAVVVLSLRNFRPYSNLDVLLEAFARVIREEPNVRLFSSAGGGWTRDETEALVDRLGIRDRMVIESVPVADLPGVVASADIAVTLADVDSSPASMLESMASRLPFVAGLAPSIDEWFAQGDGAEMVDRRNVDEVAAAILRLVRDPSLREGYAARNLRVVQERFGDPTAELEAVYDEVLGAPPRAS